jgi:hypothetical protein
MHRYLPALFLSYGHEIAYETVKIGRGSRVRRNTPILAGR